MTSKTQDAAVERIKAAAAEAAKVRPSYVNQFHDKVETAELQRQLAGAIKSSHERDVEIAELSAKLNKVEGTLEERESRIKGLLRRLEVMEAAEDNAARLAEVRIAGLLEERDAAIERNATLRRRIAAEEERRRELETLIDGARGVLFQAAKRAQQTVEK